jgi:hypothetical protein
MTEAESQKIEEFIEAKNSWEVERLYINLASSKGKALTPVEKKFLRGLLCGFSPAEIANTVYKSRSSSTVRVYLSNGLYKYIEDMLSDQTGHPVKVKNWSRVTHLLEEAGYKRPRQLITDQTHEPIEIYPKQEINLNITKPSYKEDLSEAIDTNIFYGRKTELAQVQAWIVEEQCRLVVLLGMGGIGKTAFTVKLAEQIKDKFEYLFWRSLHLSPRLESILNPLISILSQNHPITNLSNIESSISLLIDIMRASRCLIVLDNVDSILYSDYIHQVGIAHAEGENLPTSFSYVLSQIPYRQGYQAYGELIRRVGESQHQSCLILISREKPQEITALEGKNLPVHCFKLNGLKNHETRQLLQSKRLKNIKEEEYKLIDNCYEGNPLFGITLANAIQDLFGGKVDDFFNQGTMIFGDIRAILEQQFNRLSSIEKLIMSWLALNQNSVSLKKIQQEFFPMVSQRLLLEAVELLQRRSLLERQDSNFYQNSIWVEYLVERSLEENLKFSDEKFSFLKISNTIFAAQLKDYIRENRMLRVRS